MIALKKVKNVKNEFMIRILWLHVKLRFFCKRFIIHLIYGYILKIILNLYNFISTLIFY